MKSIAVMALLFGLTGCISMEPHPTGFTAKQVETANFSISIWEKNTIQKGQPLRLYYEGDGNPNPKHTVALEYAKQDKSPNVIYIARPCQWSNDKICKQKPQIYGQDRFHTEIMKEMEELTQYLVRKYQAPKVDLIGYDGGAVMALNMATKVPSPRVITIAGITDLNTYTYYHDLPEMENADNPADNLMLLAQIPQIHYVGGQDTVTPRRLVERFVARMKNPKSAVVKMVPGATHTDWGVKLDY